MDKFSQDLAAEVRSLGVTIQTVHPGFVHTKLAKLKRTSFFVPEVNAYVVATLRTLGLESRTAGFWVHKVQVICLGISYILYFTSPFLHNYK